MISFLRGIVYRIGEGYLDLDVHGVGYRVWTSGALLERARSGQELFLFTWQSVREDAIQLFGFETEAERDWFEQLIGVSGVGPKGALQIVASTTVESFAEAVFTEDIAALCRLPGVGKKTAQRLILELKDKMHAGMPKRVAETRTDAIGQPAARTLEGDVIEALISLGYNERQAAEAVRGALDGRAVERVEDALRLCLQHLSRQVAQG